MSLYENINKRKKAGTSRSKADSTISAKSYANMKAGFPKGKTGMRVNKKSDKMSFIENSDMSERQKTTMKKHAEHHTIKHMKLMVKLMKEGKSFTEAHKIAMDRVGK